MKCEGETFNKTLAGSSYTLRRKSLSNFISFSFSRSKDNHDINRNVILDLFYTQTNAHWVFISSYYSFDIAVYIFRCIFVCFGRSNGGARLRIVWYNVFFTTNTRPLTKSTQWKRILAVENIIILFWKKYQTVSSPLLLSMYIRTACRLCAAAFSTIHPCHISKTKITKHLWLSWGQHEGLGILPLRNIRICKGLQKV